MATLSTTTKLEAINAMLAAIGQAPVNTLTGGGSLDTSVAVQTLDRVNREVQSRGYHWNTDKAYTLIPDSGTGKITATSIMLQVDTVGKSINTDIIKRGDYFWDRVNHTFVIPEAVTANIVWLLDFEDIPEVARVYIYTRAGRLFADGRVGSQIIDGFTRADEAVAKAMLKKAEGKTMKGNVLTGNYSTNRVISRKSRGDVL